MTTWLAVIGGVVQLVCLILSNRFEQDKEKKAKKDEISKEWVDIIKSGDLARISAFIDKLRS